MEPNDGSFVYITYMQNWAVLDPPVPDSMEEYSYVTFSVSLVLVLVFP